MRTVILALLATTQSACMMFIHPPADTEFGRTRVSTSGKYRATIKPEGDSIPTGKLQSWVLHLETTGGTPVDSLAVAIDGGMPQHGHGLPTKPVVTEQMGHGDHLVEGMKFNMRGWWVVKFHVGDPKELDVITFNIKL